MQILVINPGSTSTKLAYYQDGAIQQNETIQHSAEILQTFRSVMDQMDFRRLTIFQFLVKHQLDINQLDAVVARGGILPPVKAGAYQVNPAMLHYLSKETPIEHPSNLGAGLAEQIRKEANSETLALIYDPVSVDEFPPIARVSGLQGIERKSIGHALNMRAVVIKAAADQQKSYRDMTVIVAHLGGGNSISLHHEGRMIDLISDDEGPFSMERTGELPLKEVFKLCQTINEAEMLRLYKREGGFKSYTGTGDLRTIETAITEGNTDWELIHDAFCYQVAKGIGELATVVNGSVDQIILTGGAAHSKQVTEKVTARVGFIAPVTVEAGEHEMMALAKGAQRVLVGAENLQEFQIEGAEIRL